MTKSIYTPLLSIIVPIYNVEGYLRKALESIRSQSFGNYEVIMVDDGSTDGCNVICDEYVRLDNRFKVIHQKNKGLSGARNAGLRASYGQYITFCDPDDYYKKDALQSYATAINNIKSERLLFCAGFDRICNDIIEATPLPKISRLLTVKEGLFFMENHKLCGFTWNKLFEREIIEEHKLLFDENYSAHEDKLFLVQYLKYVDYIYILPESIYNYIIRFSSLTYNYSNITQRVYALIQILNESFYLRKDIELDLLETRWCGAWLRSYVKRVFSYRYFSSFTFNERRTVLISFLKVSIRYILLQIRIIPPKLF